jgi:hypothetical protein
MLPFAINIGVVSVGNETGTSTIQQGINVQLAFDSKQKNNSGVNASGLGSILLGFGPIIDPDGLDQQNTQVV